MRKANKTNEGIKYSLFCFIITATVLLLFFAFFKYAPFGNNSLAWTDANIQYLDLFAYFKDVLSGKNNISYTFGKQLGGSALAVFSYYLASPLNLLVVFFDKSNLNSFFDLVVLLKMSLASATMCYFLYNRFFEKDDLFSRIILILLSICYAFSQYVIAQSSNIMWLDGVYLLPLIIYGVYRITNKESGVLLCVSIALSMIFNWYTGCINCLFSLIWLFYELIYKTINEDNITSFNKLFQIILHYGFSMLFGLFISCIVFIPTVVQLGNSGKSNFNLESITNLSFIGNIINTLKGFIIGSKNPRGSASFYCGTVAYMGLIGYFVNDKIRLKNRILIACYAFFTLLLFYWNPLVKLFSLLMEVESFWYRYSYIGIFFVVSVSASQYLKHFSLSSRKQNLIVFVFVCFVDIVFAYLQRVLLVYSVITIIFCAIYFFSLLCFDNEKFKDKSILYLIFVCIVLSELTINAKLLWNNYSISTVNEYRNYVTAEQEQIEEIKEFDKGYYRISQNKARNTNEQNLGANYNEGLVYNYWPLSSYTSSPNSNQKSFLESVGYRLNGNTMNIINTSIIGSDSLMSVKYFLSDIQINGYNEVRTISEKNGKKVYLNPYSLPMVFKFEENGFKVNDDSDPFEYQNQLYSSLIGKKTEIFIPLKYELKEENEDRMVFEVENIKVEYALYGNIPWDNEFYGTLSIDNAYETGYACWLSPSVFYIPSSEEDRINITLSSEEPIDLIGDQTRFYTLDLTLLKEITNTIQNNEVKDVSITNGRVEINANCEKNEMIFVSIPYDAGWTVTVNGEKAKNDLFGNSLYLIKPEAGNNSIIMTYKIPYMLFGTVICIIGLLGLAAMRLLYNRENHGKKS